MTKLAIMGAMQEEIDPLLEFFKDYKVINYADNNYYELTYNGLDIVIAHSKIGKVFASLTASTLIQKFSCDTLLFSGVAGAINPALNIGDLIVATKLCQHDLDITAFGHPYGFVPGGKVFVESSKELLALAKKVAEKENLKVIEGTIATGDQFIHSNTTKEFIEKTFKADALEMEGASVAVVCDALNIPFFILRAISDSANMDAGFDFDEFLQSSAKISSNYLIKIVDELIKNR
ncbi:5'-methylthioadenosine/adenosylhomocysteine nucleosidase [Aliarcobacter cibarius]|jgi:adenosylhomocysteine/aminodeoxyfutalosine nucleosidase|uniref:adenosylhomocysteine nucleosidase n=1 Tax=Aliarcobacter cibarius TaxID=255507 RepID=A0A5J6RJL7_9BACT|nr:5'-methylthioadenosine/adenosylhomocysteine nucleosidase [Aliarcobacter cibarius]QEZ89617.1 multifunctional 5'-methylthioadenosine / S-adenosylhomocysteine nucleosidase / 6-amino-6-deoxyfutalosine hydrolase [Aliarcobacter cibarius]QKJ27624.1 multifunctional 5'-methylthioadenosine / S-adenosylhomocysteine nucleosidase / 6-amino-6-deoxyfutalosine hydrolase [Aliarcobacter cibarius]TLT00662.1 5'-methylthioadenosine/adenosylhomocysteine nucleosidase [Aliarcobacter cibarius]TLT00956.1 5'-methylthi